jgi:DNA-binding transcriptional ArsR family regulator
MAKNFKQLERIVRGFSNHRRIQIMNLLDSQPDADLTDIARLTGSNFKTISEHARRLTIAGLVTKRAKGQHVQHALTERGRNILVFLRTLE